ncbi:MAG: 50S ribosomal protein L17 [Planctomycetes bacterium]|nr:50S ribosomal protein L17 [Planctomycetota bacterium]
MRHLVANRKLGRTSSHRLAMLRNMVASLIEHGRITTTLPKAKEAARFAEKCITLAKKANAAPDAAGKLHYSRMAMKELHDRKAVAKLVAEVGPKYKDRKGGYTRVLKAGFRLGDRGALALFELV